MNLAPDESVLETIDLGIRSISVGNLESLLKAIDAFQQDPATLLSKNKLPSYVESLTSGFLALDNESRLQRCKVFYNLAKVVTWKKIVVHLPTDVYLITRLVGVLEGDVGSWYISYFVLSWIYILSLSPFKLAEVHDRVYRVVERYSTVQTLHPIVARIHAQLLLRNTEAFKARSRDLDLLTINYFLKECKPDDPLIDDSVLDHFNSLCFKHSAEIISLRILPKLFKINASHDNWEAVEDIVSCFLSNLSNPSTDYRFALAHSFSKVVISLIRDWEDLDTAKDLVESCVHRVKVCLNETPSFLIDHDYLHTNLLIVAELCGTMAEYMLELVDVIVIKIVPLAVKFQQIRMNEIKGSQIKDASNFICWSLARSTRLPGVKLTHEIIVTVFLNLLVCSYFDRDLLVRKSANAALQEVLGRCFATADTLDNNIIIKIMELPFLNLTENYVNNATTLCKFFASDESCRPFGIFMLDWLIDTNFSANYDLEVVRLTIQALVKLAQLFPTTISRIKYKLDSLTGSLSQKETATAARALNLMITIEKENLFSLQGIKPLGEINALMENISQSVKVDHTSHAISHANYFEFLTIFEYWAFSLKRSHYFIFNERQIEICFHIVRITSESPYYHNEFKQLFNEIVRSISRNSRIFSDSKDEKMLWTIFEKFIRLNNSLTSSALPELPPAKFNEIFFKSLPMMDCQRKSQLLDSLSDRLPDIVSATGDFVLDIVVQLLSDYTITQQGDVGRLVRMSASKIVARHRTIFWNQHAALIDNVINNLLRLSGEQVQEIRVICFTALCEIYDCPVEVHREVMNCQLLDFHYRFFRGMSSHFWKGYMITGGAINFSITDVTNSIDDFLNYYYALPNEQDRLDVCNCLMRAIPSANEITEHSKDVRRNFTGVAGPDIIKNAITFLNFWRRLIESGLIVDSRFNFEGVYAKIYNLSVIKGSSLLKLSTIQFFPHLVSLRTYSLNEMDIPFANKIIKRLRVLANKEALQDAQANGSECSLVHKALIEALAQIYSEHGYLEQLEHVKKSVVNHNRLHNLSEIQLTL